MENIINLDELFWILGLTLFTTTMIITYGLFVFPYLKNIMTPTLIGLTTSLFVILIGIIHIISLISLVTMKEREML